MTLAARMTPGRSAAERSSPGHGGPRRPGRDPGAAMRSFGAAVSAALIAVAFGLALPRVAFYRAVHPGSWPSRNTVRSKIARRGVKA
jgi:hypothetical protein